MSEETKAPSLAPQRRRRPIGTLVLGAVLAAGLVAAVVLALRPRAVAVETALVSRGPMRVSVDQDGRTRVKDRYVVSAPLAGTVARSALHVGDTVRVGDVVARLVPLAAPLLDPRARDAALARVTAADAAWRQAGTAVAEARSAREFAARESERAATLLAGGAIAPRDAEQAALGLRQRTEALASAEFGQRVAEAELRIARSALQRFEGAASGGDFVVRAPVAGQVLRVPQENAGVVQPGTPLVEIGDAAAIEVVVDVLTADAVEIRPGAPVVLDRWGGAQPLAGRVRRVEPSAFTHLSALGVEEQRVNVLVDLEGPRAAWQALGDGFRVDARIRIWEAADVVRVPAGAVFRHGEAWAVFAVREGRAVRQPIRIGRRNGVEVQVLDGLRPGDEVVLYPGDTVEDGVRLEVARTPAAKPSARQSSVDSAVGSANAPAVGAAPAMP